MRLHPKALVKFGAVCLAGCMIAEVLVVPWVRCYVGGVKIDKFVDLMANQQVKTWEVDGGSPIPGSDFHKMVEMLRLRGVERGPGEIVSSGDTWSDGSTYVSLDQIVGRIDLGGVPRFAWAVIDDGVELAAIGKPTAEYVSVLRDLQVSDLKFRLIARWWIADGGVVGCLESDVSGGCQRMGIKVGSVVATLIRFDEQVSRISGTIHVRVVYKGTWMCSDRDATVGVDFGDIEKISKAE